MPISVTCPSCGSKIKAPDGLAGRRANCPKCKAPINVPAANGSQEPAQPPSRAAAPIQLPYVAPPSTPEPFSRLDDDEAASIRERRRPAPDPTHDLR